MSKNLLFTIIGLLFVSFGIGGYYFYKTNPDNPTIQNIVSNVKNTIQKPTTKIQVNQPDYSYVMDLDFDINSTIQGTQNGKAKISIKNIEGLSFDNRMKSRFKIGSIQTTNFSGQQDSIENIEFIWDNYNIYTKNVLGIMKKLSKNPMLTVNPLIRQRVLTNPINQNEDFAGKFVKDNSMEKMFEQLGDIGKIEIVQLLGKASFTNNYFHYLQTNNFGDIVSKKYLTKGSYKIRFNAQPGIGNKQNLSLKAELCDLMKGVGGNQLNNDAEIKSCKDNIDIFNKTYSPHLYLIENGAFDTIGYSKEIVFEYTYGEGIIKSLKLESQLIGKIEFKDSKLTLNLDPLPLKMLGQTLKINGEIYTNSQNQGFINIDYKLNEGYLLFESKFKGVKMISNKLDINLNIMENKMTIKGNYEKSNGKYTLNLKKGNMNLVDGELKINNNSFDINIKGFDSNAKLNYTKNKNNFNLAGLIQVNNNGEIFDLNLTLKSGLERLKNNLLPDYLFKISIKAKGKDYNMIYNLDNKLTNGNLIGRFSFDDGIAKNKESGTMSGTLHKDNIDVVAKSIGSNPSKLLVSIKNNQIENKFNSNGKIDILSNSGNFQLSYNSIIENKLLDFYTPNEYEQLPMNIRIPQYEATGKIIGILIGLMMTN